MRQLLLISALISWHPLGHTPSDRGPAPVQGVVPATTRRAITADTVIDGVPCARTTRARAEFHANGRLLECPLSRDASFGPQQLPRGSWVLLHADGSINGSWLSRDTPLSGISCKGDGYKQWSVRFYPTAELRLCFLRVTTVIEGVPCRAGTFWGEIRGGQNTAVHLHRNGRLARCQVAHDTTVGGVRYAAWEVVTRDSTGRATADRVRR